MAWLSMLLFVIAAITAVALTGYGFGRLADHGLRRSGLPVILRSVAALAGAAAVALYALGLLGVIGAIMTAQDGGTDSAPPQSCRTPGWWERHEQGIEIVDWSVSYLPLGFVCETSDGGSYDNGDVPGYVNPAALGLALSAAGCAVGSGYATELRTRRREALREGR
ncbi:hypothetical protein [Streptomyces sp. WM6386]|uniref:hypothetical protein n=1 Tax=Streptomyces sp. WM6386 TaxID=1415558 RepID=UPI0006199E96|nr:hypothetical protein [Streptomyces sp. WM6386]KKD02572.1 hypothetical protein TN53_39755 [Streptomyces sp. WM6386]